MKELLRDVRPDIFALIKDKNLYLDISRCSGQKIEFICPRCGNIVVQTVSQTVMFGLSCKKCGDGISFGEKFVFNVLEQLHLNFDTHVMFPWSDHRTYDIVVYGDNHINIIIEVHGKQHYSGGFETYGGRDYQQEVENDNYKMNLAFSNGFNQNTYIVVDCKESKFEYIKYSIQENIFFNKYDLNNIDWNKCMENAMSSYSIKAQKLWDKGYKIEDISSQLKISRTTIRKYLKQGAEIGICSYSVEQSYLRRRSGTFVPAARGKIVAYIDNKQIFYSMEDASRHSGIPRDYIMKYCNNKYKDFRLVRIGNNTKWKIINKEDIDYLVKNEGYTIIGEPPKSTIAS